MSVAHRRARLCAAMIDRLTFAGRSSKRHTGYRRTPVGPATGPAKYSVVLAPSQYSARLVTPASRMTWEPFKGAISQVWAGTARHGQAHNTWQPPYLICINAL
jgi:hypothetical protein